MKHLSHAALALSLFSTITIACSSDEKTENRAAGNQTGGNSGSPSDDVPRSSGGAVAFCPEEGCEGGAGSPAAGSPAGGAGVVGSAAQGGGGAIPGPERPTGYARRTREGVSPVIDGKIDEIWALAPIYDIANPMQTTSINGGPQTTRISARWRAMWEQRWLDNTDPGSLYLLVEVKDAHLSHVVDTISQDTHTDRDDNDEVRLFFDSDDLRGEHYDASNNSIIFSWDKPNPRFWLTAISGITFAQVNTASGYVMEIDIPMSGIHVYPWWFCGTHPVCKAVTEGTTIGFEVVVHDGRDDAVPAYKERTVIAWAQKPAEGSSEWDPRPWGHLTLATCLDDNECFGGQVCRLFGCVKPEKP